jgi:hypothetical protein
VDSSGLLSTHPAHLRGSYCTDSGLHANVPYLDDRHVVKENSCDGSIGKDCGIAEGGLHELTTPSAMLFARANMGRNE